jgi:HEPN domain-containing protein
MARLGAKDESVLPEQVCFHAQQAAEKALKAVCLALGIDFPYVHDLEQLREVLETAGVSLPPELADVDDLTPYAVDTRYPGILDEIAVEDVENALRTSAVAVAWAERRVGEASIGT